MLEKLIEIAVAARDRLTPVVVLEPFEGGGVIRLGQYNRTLGPGIHWKWPVIEKVHEVTTCVTTWRSPPQTLTTRDGIGVVVAGVVKYRVRNVKPYIVDIFDQGDVLGDVTMGSIRKVVAETDYTTLVASPPEKKVLDTVREEVNEYGFKIERFTFTDLAKVRSFRLIQEHGKDLAN